MAAVVASTAALTCALQYLQEAEDARLKKIAEAEAEVAAAAEVERQAAEKEAMHAWWAQRRAQLRQKAEDDIAELLDAPRAGAVDSMPARTSVEFCEASGSIARPSC